jgi:hypothetical protein
MTLGICWTAQRIMHHLFGIFISCDLTAMRPEHLPCRGSSEVHILEVKIHVPSLSLVIDGTITTLIVPGGYINIRDIFPLIVTADIDDESILRTIVHIALYITPGHPAPRLVVLKIIPINPRFSIQDGQVLGCRIVPFFADIPRIGICILHDIKLKTK